MPNPFMVNQAGMGSGMLDLGMGLLDRGLANRDREAQEGRQIARQDELMAAQQQQQQAAQQQQQAILGEASRLVEAGDMDAIESFMIQNPQVAKAIGDSRSYVNEVTKQNQVESYLKILKGQGKAGTVMEARKRVVKANGGDENQVDEFMALNKEDRVKEAELGLLFLDDKAYANYKDWKGENTEKEKPFAQGSGVMAGYSFNPNTGEYSQDSTLAAQLENKATKERDAALAKDRYIDAKVRKSINTDVTSLTNDSKMISQAYTDLAKLKETSSPTDQLAAVFKLMKALDPESVVREGEQAQARSTGGPADSLVGLYNKLWGGGSLPPNAFTDMVNTSRILADSQNTATTSAVTSYLDTYEETLPPSFIKKLKARVPFLEPLSGGDEVGAAVGALPEIGSPEYDKVLADKLAQYDR